MRSRYSAYSRANIAYIVATQTGPAAENFNANEAKAWAQSIKWLGLEVLRSEQGQATDNTGIVEFIARYQFNKQIQQLHEVSEFKKLNDRWYYCRTVL
jgi:SEC-C motif-containing protein